MQKAPFSAPPVEITRTEQRFEGFLWGERADVAFGSLYTYFENKEAIVDAVVAEALSNLMAVTQAEADLYDDPAEEIAAAARRVATSRVRSPPSTYS